MKNAVVAAIVLASGSLFAQTIERSTTAYEEAPTKDSFPVARPVKRILFELKSTDATVKNAFLRWAEEAGAQVNWQMQSELPLDATGHIEAISLADAMTKVAQAFATRAQPFVIREYDNTIVVLPRWMARP